MTPSSRAADLIRAGKILAVKGLGGFHLMVDARNGAAINRLRERKHRHEKPFAIMVPDLGQVRLLCEVSPEAAALLTSAEAPIVLLEKRAEARSQEPGVRSQKSGIRDQESEDRRQATAGDKSPGERSTFVFRLSSFVFGC